LSLLLITTIAIGKEKEVLAMENGGNKKVNAIWEAHLARAGGRKPETGADLASRERYIRDKYERRKFFDPDAFHNYHSNEPSIDELVPQAGADFANFDDAQVSDAAKLRANKKKKAPVVRNKSFDQQTNTMIPARSKSSELKKRTTKAAAEPAVVVDLLDFGSPDPTPPPAAAVTNNVFGDFFAADQNSIVTDDPHARKGGQERPGGSRRTASRSRSQSRGDMRTKSKTPDREKTRKTQQQDILNMYNAPLSNNSMVGSPGVGLPVHNGMAANNNMNNNNMNMMALMQQMQTMNMNPQMQMQQQQMQQQQMQPQQQVAGKHNSRLQVHQNLMVQQMQQQQQQQRQYQQMQRMMQQNPAMMQQMQAQMQLQQQQMMNPSMMMMMNNSSNPNMMHGMNPMMMNPMMAMNQGTTQPMVNNAFGGMPMAGATASNLRASATNKVPEKDDPFAQFGANAFR
jgi:hypothetical protein